MLKSASRLRVRLACLVAIIATSGACTPELMQAMAAGMAAAAPASYAGDSSPRRTGVSGGGTQRLLLFGGEGNRVFLGCVNCSRYAGDSVLNTYGVHGSRYASQSIFNRYGQFGSRYSNHSPCNPYASNPPVIVDDDGQFYGRLTVNRYHAQASRDASLLSWISGVCADR